MKKKKYDVLEKMTKDGIIMAGMVAYLNRAKWFWIALAVTIGVWGVLAIIKPTLVEDSPLYGWSLISVVLVEYGIAINKGHRYGRKIWSKVEFAPEPKDLREV
jgi:hypothetical protein